jgi:CTP synthase
MKKPAKNIKEKAKTAKIMKIAKPTKKVQKKQSKPAVKISPKIPASRHKYIFVVGGVMSGVGKGIATSSIGTLLQAKGFVVNLAKVDPYLNVDAGTMNPTEHGEVFVLDSGLETDQDMGNYERFLNRDLSSADYMTSGMIYKAVIERERNLGYKGKCIEAIPHIRDEIVARFERAAKVNKSEISVIEIGGTVGDYQNIMFIEAARVLKIRHPEDVIFIMVSYLPIPSTLGEMKSRPTQNAVNQLAGYGVYTDIIIARSEMPVDEKRKEKIAAACNLRADHVISAPNIESVYDIPLNFERDKLGDIIMRSLHLEPRKNEVTARGLRDWRAFAEHVKNGKNSKNGEKKSVRQVHIAIVGKYFNTGDFVLTDAYVSVLEAIKYSAYKLGVKPVIHTVNARDFENEKLAKNFVKNKKSQENHTEEIDFSVLDQYDGILVPGGFGETGIEGKLAVIRYAREKGIPFFGLCYGMQLMVIEYARHVLGLANATTSEIDPKSPQAVIDIMPDQKVKLARGEYGASMRLGAYKAKLKADTIAREAYGTAVVSERHRHRYEVNPAYIKRLEKGISGKDSNTAGLVFSGTSPDGTLMEIAELPRATSDNVSDSSASGTHPFFLGTQFHPEFLARPLRPHPLFTAFIEAAMKKSVENVNIAKAHEEEKENKKNEKNEKNEIEKVMEKDLAPVIFDVRQ